MLSSLTNRLYVMFYFGLQLLFLLFLQGILFSNDHQMCLGDRLTTGNFRY